MIDVERYVTTWCRDCKHVHRFDFTECNHDQRRGRYIDVHIMKACINGNWFENVEV